MKARVACSPERGSGACTWAGVARSTPAGTQSSAARNANPIRCSGSRPASRTHRSRLPARLSTTTCSSATGLSTVRSTLGSSRIRTGTSTGAADVSCSSRTTATGPAPSSGAAAARTVSARSARSPAAGGGAVTCTWTAAPPPGGTSTVRGVKVNRTTPSSSEPDSTYRRGWLLPRLSTCTVNRPCMASRRRTTAGSVRIVAGPPTRGTTSAISTSVCTCWSLSGRSRSRSRRRCAGTGRSGRASSPIRTTARSPGISRVGGTVTVSQGGGSTGSTRYPSTIDDRLVSCSSTPPVRAPSRTASPSATTTSGGRAPAVRGTTVVGGPVAPSRSAGGPAVDDLGLGTGRRGGSISIGRPHPDGLDLGGLHLGGLHLGGLHLPRASPRAGCTSAGFTSAGGPELHR